MGVTTCMGMVADNNISVKVGLMLVLAWSMNQATKEA